MINLARCHPNSTPAGISKVSRKWNVVLVAVGLALALVPLRATPQASVQDHSWWVWRWWLPSIALLAPGVMRKWPGRRIVLVAASLMYFAVYLLHPVCDEIPEAVKGNFETVRTLEERARQG